MNTMVRPMLARAPYLVWALLVAATALPVSAAEQVIEDFDRYPVGESVVGQGDWVMDPPVAKARVKATLYQPGDGNGSAAALRLEGGGNAFSKYGEATLELPFENPGYEPGETVFYSAWLRPVMEDDSRRIHGSAFGVRVPRQADQPMTVRYRVNPEGMGPSVGFRKGGSGSPFNSLVLYPGEGGGAVQEQTLAIESGVALQADHWYEVRLVIQPRPDDWAASTGTVYVRDVTAGEQAFTVIDDLRDVPLNLDGRVNPSNFSVFVLTNRELAEFDNLATGRGGAMADAQARRPAWELIEDAQPPARPQGPSRTYVVATGHLNASDQGPGTAEQPFKTISRAATLAGAGDTVLVHGGEYREWVRPLRGGEEGNPVTYTAAPGERVVVKGSIEWKPRWEPLDGQANVLQARLDPKLLEPYQPSLDEAEDLAERRKRGGPAPGPEYDGLFNPFALRTRGSRGGGVLGQVFVDGQRLTPIHAALKQEESAAAKPDFEKMSSAEKKAAEAAWRLRQAELGGEQMLRGIAATPGSFGASADGATLYVHLPDSASSAEGKRVEITTRYRVFAPARRGHVNHLVLRGFTFEHCANQPAFPQEGMVSTRSGRDWLIENNTIRLANAVGLDIGQEHYAQDSIRDNPMSDRHAFKAGFHTVRNNLIADNGQLGIGGYGAANCMVVGNVVERNGGLIPGAESAGIKWHGSRKSRFEGNLVRDNDAGGIWLDTSAAGSRVTRNLCINNAGMAIFVELTYGPVLIDNNLLLFNRGDGFYSHDASEITFAHNLSYGNAKHGVSMMVVTGRSTDHTSQTPRPAHAEGQRIFNNIFGGNAVAAISLPALSQKVKDNLADRNILSPAGEATDHVPLFAFTRKNGQIKGIDPLRKLAEPALGEAAATVPANDLGLLLTLDQWRSVTGQDTASVVADVRFVPDAGDWSATLQVAAGALEIDARAVEGIDRD